MNPTEYLLSLAHHGIKLGLDNISHLLREAGDPHLSYPTVHVAGTNGKGSVVAMLHAMLRAAGYRVGRFTSPHLMDLRERFVVDGEQISPEALAENTTYFREIMEGMDASPTFFEVTAAIAFRWFQQEQVDVALIEVGLGGRLDATNVVQPVASVITSIDLEHTEYLGDTLAAIAGEKAGILKEGVPGVIGECRAEPLGAIEATAQALGVPLRVICNQDFAPGSSSRQSSTRSRANFAYAISGPPWQQRFNYQGTRFTLHNVQLSLAGAYQGQNAAVAVATAETIATHFPNLNSHAVVQGLGRARWPGRLERVLDSPPVIIDVAHNVAGARQLAASVQRAIVLLGVASDKNAGEMIAQLAPVAERLILTEFEGERALPVAALAAAAGQHAHVVEPNLRQAITRGMQAAWQECPLIITGSIYLAGQARELLMKEYGARPLEV
jgi:dihydrofolate synthase/folylpolyglutamate synthase